MQPQKVSKTLLEGPKDALISLLDKALKLVARDAKLEVFDTISMASGFIGWPRQILQKAKKKGCPGFRNSRFYILEAAPWLKENIDSLGGGSEKEEAQIEKLLEEVRRLRLINDTRSGLLIQRQEVANAKTKELSKIREILRKVENEYPAKLEQLNRDEIKPYIKSMADEILKAHQACAELWPE